MSDNNSTRTGTRKNRWDMQPTEARLLTQATINTQSLPASTPPLPINRTISSQQTSTVELPWPVQIGQLKLQVQQHSESSASESNGKSCESNIIDVENGEKQ